MNSLYTEIIPKIRGKKILYVEDDGRVAKQIVEFVGLLEATVIHAASRADAMELYKKSSPDIALIDINLPDGSGLELATKIRAEDRYCRIIMLTAFTEKEYLLTAIDIDVTSYLVKPVSEQKLLEVFQKALNELEGINIKKDTVFLAEGLAYDKNTLIIRKEDTVTQLSANEAMLLDMLLDAYPGVLTYEMIEHAGDSYPTINAIRLQIKKLRAKTSKELIENISQTGYRLCLS